MPIRRPNFKFALNETRCHDYEVIVNIEYKY